MQALFGAFFQAPKAEPPPSSPQQHPQRLSPFPYLPLDILQRILHLGGLRSKDILAVAATCRPLYRCAPMAYNAVHFPLEASTGTAWGMHALLHTLQLLMQTICRGRGYPAQIFRITLFAARPDRPRGAATEVGHANDPYGPSEPAFFAPDLFARALRDTDLVLAQLVGLATHLRTFVLDASAAGQALAFPATLTILAHDRTRTFTELALVRVCTGVDADADVRPVQGSLRTRHVTVRSEDLHLVRAFLSAPIGIRSLDFRESVGSPEAWASLFNGGFHDGGHARDVERLILTCGGHNPYIEDHSEFVTLALSDSWTNLTTLSISAFAKVKENLPPLTAYGCPLRRLRLTVNVDDQFVPEFEPEFAPFLIGGILNCFPDLEELVFDHMRATLFAYALNEQCLMEWAMSIRGSHRLRVLALSSLFVLEPKECGSDYADAGTVISDVDMSEGFGPGLLISEVEAGIAADLSFPEDFVDDLAAFAGHFFDRHLRSECLRELRFLYNDLDSGYTNSIGFRPRKIKAPEVCTPEGEYAAVPLDTGYELFWEPPWRQRPEDYMRSFLYTREDNRDAD
ncbi:hypothetical protein FOMPIDRAFT_90424 [Fomitopsis schrenkii]|uniref:F-box domain-containing protein n=1 Tax=Fomitopsis schrenkii TaxID=2126942 RepID=S8FBB8_FOMSC|nr:hypothetical protein FOMPIDRAFT_90424 [Fomitopsis schrenkii]